MASQTDSTQYLTFTLADDEYAISVLRVKEIIKHDTVTQVPATPAWVRGVVNLRGGAVPVVDLAVKFGMPERQVTPRTCIVVVETTLNGKEAVMGLMADAVNQVFDINASDIQAAPAFGTRVRVDYLKGMGRSGTKFVLLLDVDKVLSADELIAALPAEDVSGEEEPEELVVHEQALAS
jgi:purine-binding chemotaxis protein CheW